MNASHYPRPEYPRPDRQRGLVEGIDWLNLNGAWAFRFDGERKGIEEKWFLSDAIDWREQIIVPFCWESLAAWGESNAAGNENYYSTRVFRNPLEVSSANHRSAARYEVGWYRRSVNIPEHWMQKRTILTIGAADFFTDCWCNGIYLGSHEGGYEPFEFDLTEALDENRNATLVVRVEDPMDNRQQPAGKQWGWYTTTSGIWQTVFLEPRDESFINHFRIFTDISARTASFEIQCTNAKEGAQIFAEIKPPSGPAIEVTFAVEGSIAKGITNIDPFYLWDPNNPFLYYVRLRLSCGGDILDVVHTYFGMRQITTTLLEAPHAPAALVLNGQPIYLRGALYQSYFPDGVYTARDVSTIQNDIKYAKAAGFDFLRIHIKIDDPLTLYYADTLGILLMCDFPNFGEGGDTPIARRRFEYMMRTTITRDFNHPSIIAWCLFNETWGFGGQVELVEYLSNPTEPPSSEAERAVTSPPLSNESSHEWVQNIWELAKSLDPTRFIEDMSVVHWKHLAYFAHGDTDINSWHFYLHDYEEARDHIASVVAQTYAGSTFNYVKGFQQGTQPLINSEYGGIGALDGDRDISWSFKFLTNELRRHASLSAYIYTQLHDVEWENNGFLKYDRTAKIFGYDPIIINQGDVLPIDEPPISERPLGSFIKVDVVSSHYSRTPREKMSLHWRLSGIDSLGQIYQDLVHDYVPIAFPHYQVVKAHTIELQLPNREMLCTLWVNAIDGYGTVVASNFVQYHVTSGCEPAQEDLGHVAIFRVPVESYAVAQWNEVNAAEPKLPGSIYGHRHGFFKWNVIVPTEEIAAARRIKILCEASSHQMTASQTDCNNHPTTFEISLSDIPVYCSILPDHPHDTRGALSYLQGGYGSYGYLAHAVAEGELLNKIKAASQNGVLRLRCCVPENAIPQEGLTIYGARAGRYPLGPTIIFER